VRCILGRESSGKAGNQCGFRIDGTRMLGPRLDLARSLGMALPARIKEGLLTPRNAVVHSGTDVTDPVAWEAIAVARELVNEYEPIASHCQEPGEDHDCEPSRLG
jgi:hypothetical protein